MANKYQRMLSTTGSGGCCCIERKLDIVSFQTYRPIELTGLGSTESSGEPVSQSVKSSQAS